MMTGMDLSLIDYESPRVGVEVASSLHETGFCVLVNHPIENDLINRVYADWSAFFDSEAKLQYLFSPSAQDGYFPRAAVGEVPVNRDDKEFYHLFSWGRVPREVSGAALEYRRRAMQIGSELLAMIEQSTPPGVRSGFSMPLSRMLVGGEKNTLLRILRYPSTDEARPGLLRAGEHSDTNLLTVLAAGSAPGLEIRQGELWREVPWSPGSLTINAGSMLEMVSGGYYPSAFHRVVKPIDEAAPRPRLAMPLVLHPADEVVLEGSTTARAYLAGRQRANLAHHAH